MVTFFILLVVLMVLVVAAGTWAAGPHRRVYYGDVPRAAGRRGEVIEETIDEPELRPMASRRIVRRRRVY